MKPCLMSIAAGLLVGVVYSLLGVRSPGPPAIALVGLLGILLGEQIVPFCKRLATDHPAIAFLCDGDKRQALVQWPGGSVMQLYWHTQAPNYSTATTVPESRIYLTEDASDNDVASWKRFARATVVSDDRSAPGEEIGQPGRGYRRIRLSSGYGRTTLIVTSGALSWPYGRELTGYEVADLDGTLARAEAAGVTVLVQPYAAGGRRAAMLQFPGGHIAEVHSDAER